MQNYILNAAYPLLILVRRLFGISGAELLVAIWFSRWTVIKDAGYALPIALVVDGSCLLCQRARPRAVDRRHPGAFTSKTDYLLPVVSAGSIDGSGHTFFL